MLVGQGHEDFIELLTQDKDMPFFAFRKQIGRFSEMYMFAEKFGWTPKETKELFESDHETYMQFRMFLSGLSAGSESKGKK